MPDPHPRECAERDLQCTRPVDPAQRRIRRHPAIELAEEFVQIIALAREEKGLREQRQMLMAIELPHDFVIARAREVQVRNTAEVVEAGRDLVEIIATP